MIDVARGMRSKFAVWEGKRCKGMLTMRHEATEVASHDAMPCRALPLVELAIVLVMSDSSMEALPK